MIQVKTTTASSLPSKISILSLRLLSVCVYHFAYELKCTLIAPVDLLMTMFELEQVMQRLHAFK